MTLAALAGPSACVSLITIRYHQPFSQSRSDRFEYRTIILNAALRFLSLGIFSKRHGIHSRADRAWQTECRTASLVARLVMMHPTRNTIYGFRNDAPSMILQEDKDILLSLVIAMQLSIALSSSINLIRKLQPTQLNKAKYYTLPINWKYIETPNQQAVSSHRRIPILPCPSITQLFLRTASAQVQTGFSSTTEATN